MTFNWTFYKMLDEHCRTNLQKRFRWKCICHQLNRALLWNNGENGFKIISLKYAFDIIGIDPFSRKALLMFNDEMNVPVFDIVKEKFQDCINILSKIPEWWG